MTAPLLAAILLQLPATQDCRRCAQWNTPQPPIRIHGSTYYVGTRGLSAILIASPEGHVLIDGALPESAPLVAASIRSLGYRLEDVKAILVSHAHFDHAGGIHRLQRASGARVVASAEAARVLRTGRAAPNDPQFGDLLPMEPVRSIEVIADSGVVRVGSIAVTAHATPGHTPGGTSWSWRSCDSIECAAAVYVDSQTPVAAGGFRYSASPTYPSVLTDFERGQRRLRAIRCDIVLSPHPEATRLWQRLDGKEPLLSSTGCTTLADSAQAMLNARLAEEAKATRR